MLVPLPHALIGNMVSIINRLCIYLTQNYSANAAPLTWTPCLAMTRLLWLGMSLH